MPWYRVECEEVHKVIIETKAENVNEAMTKVEDGEWDDNTFIVDDETLDRQAICTEEIEEETEE